MILEGKKEKSAQFQSFFFPEIPSIIHMELEVLKKVRKKTVNSYIWGNYSVPKLSLQKPYKLAMKIDVRVLGIITCSIKSLKLRNSGEESKLLLVWEFGIVGEDDCTRTPPKFWDGEKNTATTNVKRVCVGNNFLFFYHGILFLIIQLLKSEASFIRDFFS